MGPDNTPNTYFTVYGQRFDSIADFDLNMVDDSNEQDPLIGFLNVEPMEFSFSPDYSRMVSEILSSRHGAIYRKTKKWRIKKKCIHRIDKYIMRQLLGVKK